ncbi:MAG: ATP-binding cassette domain-containing protein [Planctomycetales bacterium]
MKLEAIGIGRKVGDRWLFENISLLIRGGHRFALVGPSGCGKTLLLRSLALLDPLDAGAVWWQGECARGDEIPRMRGRVIYLRQRPVLVEGSVEDNLRLPFGLQAHRGKKFDRDRIIDLLKSLDREESFLSKRQRDLSGGETQIAAFLRALQLDPNVLLLDEPTAALDSRAIELIEALVGSWLDEQPTARATVWVTHDEQQARRVSTTMKYLRDGRLTGEANDRLR